MPMNLLNQIANHQMPYVTKDDGEIERLRILYKAGHVLCELPSERLQKHQAVVHQVTALGRLVLRHFGLPIDNLETWRRTALWH